ncbi:MAG: 3-dehydroquinate synthase [Catenisphaera adipataccumulans]|jgi:3-dehydroquinate synthase|uniref:3-dehydroquinate synthase n=1 Tax=Catenisphaera adipataccumulans TaxID=700500 RepID=UPI003D8ED1E5
MKMVVHLDKNSYPIVLERGVLTHIGDFLDVQRKVALITESGVPEKWVELIRKQLPDGLVLTFPEGEGSKCFTQYENLLKQLIDAHFTRKDAVIALGGGVTGDLAGFVASSYMRGIDFYNLPTTVLSQVDSSVGGKVAIDVGAVKNIVGAFYQPKAVLIDPDVLQTLPQRQINNGLMEALKTGLIQDPELFRLFESDDRCIDAIIEHSIDVKRRVVEQDEKESGLRKCLNFGHTIGHAIEGAYGLNTYLHGECVAMGMLFMIENAALKKQVLTIYEKLHIPPVPDYDVDVLMDFIAHDKKNNADSVTVVLVKELGSFVLEQWSFDQVRAVLERGPYEE